MIKIGIIGIGNVSWNVHLPVLLSREDVKIIWICDINGKKKKIIEKKKFYISKILIKFLLIQHVI